MKFLVLMPLLLLCILNSTVVRAAPPPQERMNNPVLEKQAQALYKQIRCTVCQNQSIAKSSAKIAADLRTLIRKKLQDGESAPEILDYIHSRYGDFVLMRPPLKPQTWFLWFGPFIILLFGGGLCFRLIKRERKSA